MKCLILGSALCGVTGPAFFGTDAVSGHGYYVPNGGVAIIKLASEMIQHTFLCLTLSFGDQSLHPLRCH